MLLEQYRVTAIERFPDDGLTGRRKILTAKKEITAENVRDVLQKAISVHAKNAAEIQYLWDYYKSRQDIRFKVKYTREAINTKLCVNRASQIVAFKSAFLLSSPVQYISYGGNPEISEQIDRLNEYMRFEDKDSVDKEIVDWMHICGVGERFTLPDAETAQDGAPFFTVSLDPRYAFVIYSSTIGQKPMAGVILQQDENERQYADVYTRDKVYTVYDDSVTEKPNPIGEIPLVEYPANMARMGAFEDCLSILNGINELESNALDSIRDFVNAFDVFQNCDIEDGVYQSLAIGGQALKIKTSQQGYEAKVYRVFSELNQSGVQTRIDDLTDAYLTICGMPNRNMANSASDTGQGAIFRDGWAEAASRAADSEKMFKKSERDFLRVVLNICNANPQTALDVGVKDIQVKIPRQNLQNAQSLVQILCEMLNNDKIHPKLAFEAASGLFKDAENAFMISEENYEKEKAEQEEETLKELENARTAALRDSGQDDSETGAESD